MVGAEDRAPHPPRALDYREVIGRVDFIRDLTGSQVAGADKFVNERILTDQQAATLARRLVAGVPDNSREHVQPNPQRHDSTIMAVPIPPPTQSDATPRPPPRA